MKPLGYEINIGMTRIANKRLLRPWVFFKNPIWIQKWVKWAISTAF